MTTDTVLAIFSCTRAIMGAAVVQLVEAGEIELSHPAKEYAPEIAEIQVLEGFDAGGEPPPRPPETDVTVEQLMLHNAGFGFFNHDLIRYGERRHVPGFVIATQASLTGALLFDPGEEREYGSNIDWVGKVVEGVRGKRLGEVFDEGIVGPLGMDSAGFFLTDDMRPRPATMHQREDDGSLRPMPGFELPQDSEQHMGGHGHVQALNMPDGDYMKFIRTVLNEDEGENGRLLEAETVREMGQNGLGDKTIKMLPGAIPTLSNGAEFFSSMPKGWSYTFTVNHEDAPTGRPIGELGWAGLADLFYRIGRTDGIGGGWATRILPFSPARSPSAATRSSRGRSTAP